MEELFNIYGRCSKCNHLIVSKRDIIRSRVKEAYKELELKNAKYCSKHPNETITYKISKSEEGILGRAYPMQFFDEPESGKNISTETT